MFINKTPDKKQLKCQAVNDPEQFQPVVQKRQKKNNSVLPNGQEVKVVFQRVLFFKLLKQEERFLPSVTVGEAGVKK